MNKWQQYFKKSEFAYLYHKNLGSREKLSSSGKFFLLKENEDDKVIFFPPFSAQRDLTQGPDWDGLLWASAQAGTSAEMLRCRGMSHPDSSQVLSVSQTESTGGPRQNPKRAPCGNIEKHLSRGAHYFNCGIWCSLIDHWNSDLELLVKIKLNQIYPTYEGTRIANADIKTPVKPYSVHTMEYYSAIKTLFKARVLLRQNSHILKSILLKDTLQWVFLVYSQNCAAITTT